MSNSAFRPACLSSRGLGIAAALILVACVPDDPESNLARARARFVEGDYPTAAIFAQNVLQADVDNVGARVLLGRIALGFGDVTQARLHLERARDLGAPPEEFAVPLATALSEMQEAAAALRLLDTVPEASRTVDYWLTRSRALVATADYAAGVEALTAAEALGGETAALLIEQGRLAAIRGDAAGAEALLNRALDLDSMNADALLLRGSVAITAGRLEQAAADLRAAARIYESRSQTARSAAVLLRLVQVELALNEIDAATTAAQQLASVIPNGAFADYANGLVAFQRGDYSETIALLRNALIKAPDQPQFMALLGAAHLAVGNLGQAEQQFTAVLRQNPADPAAIRLLAETRIRQQRPRAALEALELFKSTDISQDLGILLLQSTALLQSGDSDGAIPYLEQALALDAGNQATALRLLQAYAAAGQTARAEELLRSSATLALDEGYAASITVLLAHLRNDGVESAQAYVESLMSERPDDPRAHMVRATFLELTNDKIAARETLEHVVELDESFFPARLAIAALLAEEGRFEDAERELLAVIRSDPRNTAALMSLARVALQRADLDAAETHLREAAQSSDSAAPRLALARLALAKGEIADAEAELAAANALAGNTPDVVVTRGMLALAKGDASDAVTLLEDARSKLPNRPSVALLLADAQAASGDVEHARDTLAEAATAMPSVPELRAALGEAEQRLGNSAEALRIAQQLQVEFPQRAVGYALEGAVLMAGRRYGEAARLYRLAYERDNTYELLVNSVWAARLGGDSSGAQSMVTARLEGSPNDIPTRLVLAELLQAEGRTDDALTEYGRVLALDANNIVALNNAAWYAHELSRPEAIGYAARAAELAPENPSALDTFGWILLQHERNSEAIEYLEKATRLAPQDFEIRYHLAVAQARVGQREAARETLQALLSEGQAFDQRDDARELLETL